MQTAGNFKGLSNEGFTLVEVLIGMLLMAIVFTASYGAYFLGMNMIEDARDQIRASQIVQSELERLRTMNWSTLESLYPDGLDNSSTAIIQPQGDFVTIFAKDYTGYRVLNPPEDVNGDGKTDLIYVRIYVRWKNSKDIYSYQNFSTIIVREGLNDYYYRKV